MSIEPVVRSMRLAAPLALVLLVGCDGEADPAPPLAPPPPVVRTLVVEPQSVANRVELIGRVEPFRTSEVRARTDGLVEEVVYEEGSDVRERDVLFRIDPRTVQAEADQAEARLQSARSAADNARSVADRSERLIGQNAISQQDYDASLEAAQSTEAAVVQAEAALRAARIALGFAEVRAPIAGRAGRAQVREGSLVSAAEGTLLVTLRRTDRVYVNLAESATDLLAIRAQIVAGDIELADPNAVAVELVGDDGEPLGITGRIDFLDQSVDEETGTVSLRAVFPNPDGLLLPGQLVDTVVLAGERPDALVVPQPAVLLGADSAAVMLAADGTAVRRPVELGPMVDGGWIVRSGLEAGDEVVLDHLQRLADGAPVRLARLEPAEGGATAGTGDAPAAER